MTFTSQTTLARAVVCALVALQTLSIQARPATDTTAARAATRAAQSESAHARLWREMQTLLAARNTDAARALARRDAAAAQSLYRELLFESFTSRLYENPRLPFADEARALLADSGAESRALEAKFDAWSKEQKPGVGFAQAGAGIEAILYLAHVAKLRGEEKDAGKDAPSGTARELTERALALSETNGSELAVASFSGTLGYYALSEKRLEEVAPFVVRAEKIWDAWSHTVGLYQAPILLGLAAYYAEKWDDAARLFGVAAERARALPELLPNRVSALSNRAAAMRNAGDKAGVLEALTAAVADQQKVLDGLTDKDARLKASKSLADLEVQLGGGLAALGRHVEASDWYVRAETLKKANYKIEMADLEAQLAQTSSKMLERIEAAQSDGDKKIYRQTLETITDTMLSMMDASAWQNGDVPTVAKIAERRLAVAREGGDSIKIAAALEAVAYAQRRAGDNTKARSTALEALRLRQAHPRRTDIYKTLSLLAEIAYYAEDWNEAIARYKEVIEVTRLGVIPPLYDLEAQPDAEIRRTQASMNSLERLMREKSALDAMLAISYARARQADYRAADELLAKIEASIPRLYAMGAPDEAELLGWIEAAKNPALTGVEVYAHRREKGFAPDKDEEQRMSFAEIAARTQRSTAIQHRAMLYEDQYDLERAARAYEQGNTMTANLIGGSFTLSGTYVALARIARERGDYASAESPIAAALEEAVRKNEPDTLANLLIFQSALRREQGRLEESAKLAEDALKIARKLSSRSMLAASLRTLGRAEGELGGKRLKQSEQRLREAIALWRELGLPMQTAYTLDNLGQTLERQGRDDDALASYIEAVRIIEGMIGSLAPGASVETFNAGRGNRELYDHLIKLLIKKNRAADALQYLERSKSKSLVDALAGASLGSKDPALNALLTRVRASGDALRLAEKELSDELARPADARVAASLAALQAKSNDARRNYAATVEELRRANPSYASLVAVNPTDLAAMRRHLPEGALMLSYFPTESELFVFVVTRDRDPSARAVKVKRADLGRMVNEYRGLVVPDAPARGLSYERALEASQSAPKRDIKEANALSSKLYDVLLAPARDEIERADTILIVPAGELYYLPFHALGRAMPNGALEYPIETKRFAYLASADLLNLLMEGDAAKREYASRTELKSESLLALGNPDGSLPGASQEVSAISNIFAKSEVYTGEQATVERMAGSAASPAPYVHFATHGVINSRDPKESYLLLAGAPGRLSVRDLVENTYKLSFEGTRLVTLSACNTNVGGFDPGAAYGSLSRAFSNAGAPTVIASLWSVDDNSTRDTMTVFYRELAAGTPKAEALRRAQLAIKRDPRYAHPFYWAPFVILGEWR